MAGGKKFNLDGEFDFSRGTEARQGRLGGKLGQQAPDDGVREDTQGKGPDGAMDGSDVQPAPPQPVRQGASKVPMMNIRFTPENYDYMRREAALRGLSVIKFTNWIIDQYRSDPSHVHANDLYQNEDKW